MAGNRPIVRKSQGKVPFWNFGVDGVKAPLSNRRSRGRTVRFSADLEPRYYEELASERLVVKCTRGMPARRWERKPGARAECLDATVYALAAARL